MAMSAEGKIKGLDPEMTLKDLTPNVAGLLCYVVGWISGVVFLVLEQKNRFVRFHALQSIIVFGILTLASTILGRIPFVGVAFTTILGITGFILWIVLMVKACSGETYKLPWAGNLAEKLAWDSIRSSKPEPGTGEAIALAPPPAMSTGAIPITRSDKKEAFHTKYYSAGARTGRIVGSTFAIAWCFILLIFFNFFNRYIALYQPYSSGGTTHWTFTPFVTSEFSTWLPVLTTTLILAIIGHFIMIVYDKYFLRKTLDVILDVFGLATVVTLLSIFPFDFAVIPSSDVAFWVTTSVTVTLILVAVGISIGILVKLIALIANTIEGKV